MTQENRPAYRKAPVGAFISCWSLFRPFCQPSCPRFSEAFVPEVLEVINICFPSSMGEEDPADPWWPLLNPPCVEPVSQFPSFFFGVFNSWGVSARYNSHGETEDPIRSGLFNAHVKFRAEPRQHVSTQSPASSSSLLRCQDFDRECQPRHFLMHLQMFVLRFFSTEFLSGMLESSHGVCVPNTTLLGPFGQVKEVSFLLQIQRYPKRIGPGCPASGVCGLHRS